VAGISYALYIWHPMTALGWLGTGGGWERYLIKRPISFALTFLLAHLSTNTLEAWFIRLAKRST
jgi:peptidoglycan/LPS O-acetylase OafA/YrhL